MILKPARLTAPAPRPISRAVPKARWHTMAQHKSALKRIRRNLRSARVNRARTSLVRGSLRSVEAAIATGDPEAARAALKAAQPEVMRGVSRGILHLNTASRRLSRLSARIKGMPR